MDIPVLSNCDGSSISASDIHSGLPLNLADYMGGLVSGVNFHSSGHLKLASIQE